MATIVFIVYPAPSHHNATFKLAHRLQQRGHRVVYAIHDKFSGFITAQGFEPYVLKQKILPSPFIKHLHRDDHRRAFVADFRAGRFFIELLADLQPALILLDYPLLPYAVFLQQAGHPPIIALQTMVCLQKDRLVPPVNRTNVPRNTWWDRLKIEGYWQLYFLTRFANHLKHTYRYGGSETSLLREVVSQHPDLNIGDIDTDVYLHYGLKQYPQLLFSPKAFDFPRPNRPDHIYLGAVVDTTRHDVAAAPYSHEVQAALTYLAAQKKSNPNRPLVFCSLGINNHLHYDRCEAFFTQLIRLFETRPDMDLLVAVGTKIPLSHFAVRPSNVYLFSAVPQLAVLPLADLMITHGGMNSITECIHFGVPMVVYPLSTDLDQRGNAARVVYHGLGVQGNIRRDGPKQVAGHLDAVWQNPAYKQRVNQMRQAMHDSVAFDKGVQFVESRLPNRTALVPTNHALPESGRA